MNQMNMMKRLMMMAAVMSVLTTSAQTFETASEAIKNMKVGWNLGNTLDAHNGSRMTDVVKSETTWGQPVTPPELMQMMQQAGFGAIRVPVTWYPHMDNNNKVDAAWMKRVHEVVDYVIDAGMYCILNVHHDTGADGDTKTWLKADETVYAQQKDRFESLWRQIAEEFRDYDQRLLFESYNEMLDTYSSWCFASFASPGNYNATVAKSAYNGINSYAQSFVNTVRATGGNNAQRNLVVNTYGACNGIGNWNSHLLDPLKEMKLPEDVVPNHLFFEVHAYPVIDNMPWMRTEVGQMFKDLNTYLAKKGAPVIIGEWGCSETSRNYDTNRENLIIFIKYFVEQAMANNFPTFFWMGISDGMFRQLPAFSQPDLAKAILQTYYGSDYEPILPTLDDFGEITYIVTYHGQWQELNLWDHDADLNQFKAIRLELGEMPRNNVLSIKVYGESDGKEQYSSVSQTSLNTTLNFNRSQLGSKLRRITLQYSQTSEYTIQVNRAFLIKNDGTEVQTTINPFWGCTMEMHVEKKDNGIHTMAATGRNDDAVYTLSGQRVAFPQRGIYIMNGKKVVFK